MKYILKAEQMKDADTRMIHKMGIPSLVLMERAALQCVNSMKEELGEIDSAIVVCGSGNNGGDGFAIARMLHEEQIPVDVVFVGKIESRSEETRIQMNILEQMGVPIMTYFPDKTYCVVVDAVFGIGLCRKIEGHYRDVIARMNQYQGYKVAVDIASGISADDGKVLGCAFQADLTVTFAYAKVGQLMHPGCTYTGKLAVKPIGIWNPEFDQEKDIFYLLEEEDIRKRMPKRKPDSNKGTYGKVLIIAGSKGMSGAAFLAAKAAYVTGAGLVQVYTEESNRQILQQLLPEAILTTYDSQAEEPFTELEGLLAWADVVCVGCGLGMSEVSQKLMKQVWSKNTKPCVLDADGLNLLAESKEEILGQLSEQYVLTPHLKEFSRLTGRSVAEIKENKEEILREFTQTYAGTVVMKDSRTLVTAKDTPIYLNVSGNAAMAKAGAGDVLAGTIIGIMAQGVAPQEAAVLGVYLHGKGGDSARGCCGEYSVLAQDIIEGIKEVLKRNADIF